MEEIVKFITTGWTPGGAGIWTGVLMFAGWILREYRETRKLSAEDRLARRDGYAKQVENLQIENRRLSEDLRTTQKEHDAYRVLCHAETDALRAQIITLESDQAGLRRRLDAQAIELARYIDPSKAPDAAAAADRLQQVLAPPPAPVAFMRDQRPPADPLLAAKGLLDRLE